MGIDRFVRWKKHTMPTFNDVRVVLEDYAGGAAMRVEKLNAWALVVVLQGRPNFPFRRIPGYEDRAAASEQHEERFFEVRYDPKGKSIDVITRQTDEFTNVVAEGFQRLVARFWKGKMED